MSNLSDSNCKLENIIWIKLVSKIEIINKILIINNKK